MDLLLPLLGVTLLIMELILEDMGPSDGTLTILTMKELDIVADDVHPKRNWRPFSMPLLPFLPYMTNMKLTKH